jgi:hypothetical protein
MKTTTAFVSLFTASLLAFGCAGDQKDPNEPDTSKETGEAVEAVGEEVEEGAEDTADAVEEGVNDGAEAVEDATDDDPND